MKLSCQLYKIAKVFEFIAQILQSITYYCKNIINNCNSIAS